MWLFFHNSFKENFIYMIVVVNFFVCNCNNNFYLCLYYSNFLFFIFFAEKAYKEQRSFFILHCINHPRVFRLMLQWKSNMDPKKIVIERLKILREAQKKIDEIMRRDNIVESLSVLKERQKKLPRPILFAFGWSV